MIIANERGVITVDYIFAMFLVAGFSFITFALSLTLTMTEVVQYMTFSSARNFYAAGMDPQDQQQRAFLKFQSLQNSEVLLSLLNSGWFEVSNINIESNLPAIKPELSDYEQAPSQNLFHGTVVYFTSNVLDFTIPLYGSTVDNDLRGQEEFGAWIGSYLGREVTQLECQNFFNFRPQNILALPTGGNAEYSQAPNFDTGLVSPDNGC